MGRPARESPAKLREGGAGKRIEGACIVNVATFFAMAVLALLLLLAATAAGKLIVAQIFLRVVSFGK